MDLKKIEQEIESKMEAGEKEEALHIVYNAVLSFARSKDFQKAEYLRDKIYEIDSLALTEIVESTEIIEHEKKDAIDKGHQNIFKNLYDSFAPEEGNAFFFALEEIHFSTGDYFLKQGEMNDSLYFLDKGTLKLIHQKGKEELFIKDVNPGEIGGVDSFFKTTVCTNSLIADSNGSLHFLKKSVLDSMQDKFAGMKPKIREYAQSMQNTLSALEKSGINRRVFKRLPSNGMIVFQILSSSGKAIEKVLKGRLADISGGGLSFYFTTANKKNVNLLLGRDLVMKFVLPEYIDNSEFKKKGRVLSVLQHMHHEYSIHLKFDKIFDIEIFK